MKWWDWMLWSVFWMLSFKSAFSFSSFTLIKRLFHSSLLSAIRVASPAYLRLVDNSPRNLDSSFWHIQPGISHDVLCASARSLQSCLTLCNPMDCSLPAYSVHGIFQARIMEWVAISFSKWNKQGDNIQPYHIPSPFWTSQFFPVQVYLLLLDTHLGFSRDM